jgi:hypothetical protein
MPTANGTAVNFGFTGANGLACSAINGILQSSDHSVEADKDEVRSPLGDIVNRNWYDQHSKATLEFVIQGATNSIAAAIAATTLANLTPGTIINITACASDPDLVGSTWEVQSGAAIKKGNTNAARLTVPLEKRAGITAASPA